MANETAKIKISGWRMPRVGKEFVRSIKGQKRTVEVIEILATEDRSEKFLNPMFTVLVRVKD